MSAAGGHGAGRGDAQPEPQARCDTRGQRCPLPVLKARRAMRDLPAGGVLHLIADDPLAEIDVPAFCREAGHVLVAAEREGATLAFTLRKGDQTA